MVGQHRLRIGLCNEMFQDWPIEAVLEYAAQLGCDGVEIAPYSLAETLDALSPERRSAIRRAAERASVEILGLHWLLVKPEGLSINHPDAAVRARTAECMRGLIHLCAELGGRLLIHGSPGQRTVRDGWNAEDCWRRARETFESCLPTIEQAGVTYCIEPLDRKQTNFVNTVGDAVQLVREIGHPGFQLMADCRAAEAHGDSAVAALDAALASGHLRHVHVNDANGRGPGFGRVAFTPILQRLFASDYQGYISVEVFQFDPDPRTIAARSVGYLKGILEALARMIRERSTRIMRA